MDKSLFDNLKKKENLLWSAFAIILFLVFYMIFCKMHPLYIYDMDDWTYISYNRIGIPAPHYWNPTKVLPEILLPLGAEIAVDVVYPVTGDYVGSIALILGCILALSLTSLIVCFGKWINRYYNLSFGMCAGCMTVLSILFFMPFYTLNFQFASMFYASNVNAVYNYAIPGIFNGILIFLLWKEEASAGGKKFDWSDKNRLFKNSILILFIYLCINSNLFHSIVSLGFVGAVLTENLFDAVKSRKKKKFSLFVKEYICDNLTYLIMLAAWFGSMILESMGERASMAGSGFKLGESMGNFMWAIKNMSKYFWLLVVGSLFLAFAVWMYEAAKRKEKDLPFIRAVWRALCGFILTSVYLILLCAKVSPEYSKSSSVLWGTAFYGIMIFAVSTGYILKKIPQCFLLLPIGAWVVASVFVVERDNYREVFYSPVVKEIGNDIVNQIVEADQKGDSECVVYIPVTHHPELPDTLLTSGDRIARTVYLHGLTTKYMNVKIESSLEKTEEYHFPIISEPD